jgi:DNA-binding IclR family transcriptional regulator
MTMSTSIRKSCQILRALDASGTEGLRLADLARQTDLLPPTTHRILRALCAEGFAEQDHETRRYRLGAAATRLGHPTPVRERVVLAARAALHELREESNETIVLAMVADGRRCILDATESRQALRVTAEIGDDERFYETATGRALLAQLPPAQFAPLRRHLGWPGRRWPGVFTDRDLAREIQLIRTSLLVVSEQRDAGITSLATPLQLPGVPAAIGLDYPAGRDSGGRRQTLGARLREAAAAIRDRFAEQA